MSVGAKYNDDDDDYDDNAKSKGKMESMRQVGYLFAHLNPTHLNLWPLVVIVATEEYSIIYSKY